jgi:KAP-like P-loop domain-containing protein
MWSDNESSLDLLGCQHLVKVVTSIINNDTLLPATIGVFGDWGSGKTSLLQMVRTKLEEDENVLVLSFNGWTFEGICLARPGQPGPCPAAVVAQVQYAPALQ